MGRRAAILGAVVLLGAMVPAQADKLILKDGRVLSGKVTSEKTGDSRSYTIVTDDGQTLTFTRDEVKRSIHESSLSDSELAQKFQEWRELVNPVLKQPEPLQREFLFRWRDYARDIRSQLWETPPDSDKFVDEWARYTANFKAVSASLDYKRLMNGRKGSNSLREYVNYPPDGREDIAAVLKEALGSFKKCLNSAKATDGLIKSLPREQVRLANSVRRRQAEARKARARRSTARDSVKRHEEARAFAERAARKEAEVFERLMFMANQTAKQTQNADARVNLFAQQRVVTLGHVKTARTEIENIGSREGIPGGPSAKKATVLQLPSGTVTQEFRRIVERHRTNSPDLTTLGVEALREKTLADIDALFVGKQWRLELIVNDIGEAGPGGYVLFADHAEDWSDTVVQTAEFRFDAGVKYELIRCKRGAKVEVEARIKQVSVRPNLPSLETSDAPAGVQLIGDVVAVKRGCQWD